MTAPCPAHSTPSGWADDRLMQAYDLIDAVRRDNIAEPEFAHLLRLIENVDGVIAPA